MTFLKRASIGSFTPDCATSVSRPWPNRRLLFVPDRFAAPTAADDGDRDERADEATPAAPAT